MGARMDSENTQDESDEIQNYLDDPEHQLLNQLMVRVTCPEKRRKILETFEFVAETPDRIEEIRAGVLAAGR